MSRNKKGSGKVVHQERGKSIYGPEDLKAGFEAYDRNGDGFLDFAEMRGLLLRGQSTLTEKQLRVLWQCVDEDNSGRVEFDEFVDFIYGKPVKKHKDRWQDTFLAFSGKDDQLNLSELLDLCRACRLVGDDLLSEADVEDIFNHLCEPDESLDPKGFSKVVARIAKKRKVTKASLLKVVKACEGPNRHLDF
mmetsp:Transcript_83037/g.173847  ORF Transcript_83037/g.173847 Transcript_83037/m.173847 type:complete len:191 (-) Transcript_83037:281-853(-)